MIRFGGLCVCGLGLQVANQEFEDRAMTRPLVFSEPFLSRSAAVLVREGAASVGECGYHVGGVTALQKCLRRWEVEM